MKVKIIKAGKPTYWYSNKIGKVFDIEKEEVCDDGLNYILHGSGRYLLASDCQILQETKVNVANIKSKDIKVKVIRTEKVYQPTFRMSKPKMTLTFEYDFDKENETNLHEIRTLKDLIKFVKND